MKRRKPLYKAHKALPERHVLVVDKATLEVKEINSHYFTHQMYDLYYKGTSENRYNTGLFRDLYYYTPSRMIWLGGAMVNKFMEQYNLERKVVEIHKWHDFKNFDRFHAPNQIGILHQVILPKDIPTPFDPSRIDMKFYYTVHDIHPFKNLLRASKIDSLLC